MIDLSNLSKQLAIPDEINNLINALDARGFDVLTPKVGRSRQDDGGRNSMQVQWQGHFIGLISKQLWSAPEPYLVLYRFVRGDGSTEDECPPECTGQEQYRQLFSAQHGCDPNDIAVSRPQEDGTKFYLSVRGRDTALKLLRESAVALSVLRLADAPGDDSQADSDQDVPGDACPLTRKQVVEARRKQDAFRSKVLKVFGNRCAVTGLSVRQMLRASHIVGFMDPTTTDEERMDANNAFAFSANIDALFDKHWISYDSAGVAQLSFVLEDKRDEIGRLDLVKKPGAKRAAYLARHKLRFDKEEAERRRIKALIT